MGAEGMSKQTVIDLLAAGRVANLPSVASNVILGCGLGLFTRDYYQSPPVFVLPVLVGCLMYLGGCFLNDWNDRHWDAERKPERAIPSGRLSARLLLILAGVCFVAGLSLSLLLGTVPCWITLVIFGFIALYAWIHKKTSWGILPMGIARGLLYPLGFFSQAWSGLEFYGDSASVTALGLSESVAAEMLWSDVLNQGQVVTVIVVGLVSYVAGLSLFARAESQPVVPQTNRWLGILLLSAPLLTHSLHWMPHYPVWNVISLLPFVVMVVFGIRAMGRSVGIGVSTLLASICLVDLIVALPLALAFMAVGFEAEAHPQAVFFPIVSFAAFLLALLLQRVAPAT